MNLQLAIAVIYLACATLLFIIAFLVFREDPRKRLNRITALMFGFAACGPLFYGLGIFAGGAFPERSAIYNIVYVWELFFPQLVFFALVFPKESRSFNRFKRLKYIVFLPHAFHLLLTTVFADPDRLIEMIDPQRMGTIGKAILEPLEPIAILMGTAFSALLDSHIQLFSTVNLAYVILAAVILYQATHRVMAPQLRKQVIVVIYGIITALVFYVIAFILPALGIIDLSLTLKNTFTILAMIIGAGSIIWAIVRYRFMDVRLIVRQSLVYTVTSALVVGAYVLIIRQFERIVEYIFGYTVPGLDVVFIIIALILFQPVMSQIDDLIRRLFIRDKSDFRNVSQTFSRKVASVFELDEIFTLAYEVLKGQLLLETVMIFVCEGGERKLRCVSQKESDYDMKPVEAEQELMKEVARRGGVNNIDELLGQFPDSEFLESLARRRIRFVAPLVSADEFLGCLAVSDKISGYRLNFEDVTTITTIADQLSLAITTSKLYQESLEKQRLDEEMNFARAIQQQLLPREFPRGPNFEFSAYSDPSLQVGGDYFDFIDTPRGTCAVVIADASGKGMPAALMISQIQAAVRTEVRHDVPLAEMLTNINELVQHKNVSDKFATLFFADLNPVDLTLRYANAGHNYPILVSKSNGVKYLEEGGLLLGVFGGVSYDQGEIKLENDDVLLLYTDGLNEAVNDNDEQYGESRVLEMLEKHKHLSAREIQRRILDDVRGFAVKSELQDDMTLVVLKVGEVLGNYDEEIPAD